MGIFNLPPIPPELKAITPYLQRAEEVKSTDPVISYWCKLLHSIALTVGETMLNDAL